GQVSDDLGHSFGAKGETAAITAGSNAIAPFECSTKYICALEADRDRHTLDILVRHRQTLARFVQSQLFDESGGRCAETPFEAAAKLSRAEASLRGECFDR